MNYQLVADSTSVKRDDGAFIPNDPTNVDWCAYQGWLADGNSPLAADPPEPAPALPSKEDILAQIAILVAQVNALSEAP